MNAIQMKLYTLLMTGGLAVGINNNEAHEPAYKLPIQSTEQTLEAIAQENTRVVAEKPAQQNKFVGPKGNYSLQKSPEDFGFKLLNHTPGTNEKRYDDIYAAPYSYITISSVETGAIDLESFFSSYTIDKLQRSKNIVLLLVSNKDGVLIKSGGGPKPIIINKKVGLQNNLEFWTYIGLSQEEGKKATVKAYTTKFKLRTAMVETPEQFFAFSQLYLQDGAETERQAKALYQVVMDSFESLK